MKYLQDMIYKKSRFGIIGCTVRNSVDKLREYRDHFRDLIRTDLLELIKGFKSVVQNSNDHSKLIQEMDINKMELTYPQFLEASDSLLNNLNMKAFIFIDELDKIVHAEIEDDLKQYFLEDLKSIADICNNSISIIVSGTPACIQTMDSFGIDYAGRFTQIKIAGLSQDQTKEYIDKKSMQSFSNYSNIPMKHEVKLAIFDLTLGNIRKIDKICSKLWTYSAENKVLVDLLVFENFLVDEMYEDIKELYPNIRRHVALLIVKLLIRHKVGKFHFRKSLNAREKSQLKRFFNNIPVGVLDNVYSYEIDVPTRNKLIKSYMGA